MTNADSGLLVFALTLLLVSWLWYMDSRPIKLSPIEEYTEFLKFVRDGKRKRDGDAMGRWDAEYDQLLPKRERPIIMDRRAFRAMRAQLDAADWRMVDYTYLDGDKVRVQVRPRIEAL